MAHKIIKVDNYLLVLDDKDKDFYAYDYGLYKNYKLGLVTGRNDDVLEFEGECIDEFNLSKIIAHLPLNGSPILEGVDLLPPYSRHQEDGVDDAVMEFKELYGSLGVTDYELSAFSKGYNKARQFFVSRIEEQILNNPYYKDSPRLKEGAMMVKVMLESTTQYPTEFETEDVLTPSQIFYPNDVPYSSPKTITTAQGVQWVGKYK